MWALIARVLGPVLSRTISREAAEQILKRHGMRVLRQFAKKIDPNDLKNMSMDDILNVARQVAEENVYKPSVARRFSAQVNRGIDYIETTTRNYVENRSLRILDQRMVDAAGKPGFSQAAGRMMYPKNMHRTQRMARGLASNTLEAFLFPMSGKQAYGGGFLRGFAGESLSIAANRLIDLVGLSGRLTLNSPRGRSFYRILTNEIKYLRQMGDISNASKLAMAVRNAYHGSVPPGVPEGLTKFSLVGNVSGRASRAGLQYFVIEAATEDDRNRRVEEFKKSLVPFVKEETRIYINSYVKDDGTRVRGHYRKRRPPQHVRGYYRSDGSSVDAYYRNTP